VHTTRDSDQLPALSPVAAALRAAVPGERGAAIGSTALGAWIAVACLTTQQPALAQSPTAPATPDKPAAQEKTLPEVKVEAGQDKDFRTEATRSATRTETPLRDIPQFINTVPQSVIRSQGATTLPDALRNVPGISYAAAEGGSQNNQVFVLRGSILAGDLFIDGVRDLGEYNRDLFAIDSVEVLKGASSLTFGRGSPGGVINQTSKIAGLSPIREVGATVGSFDQKRLTADLNVRTGESSALRIVAMGEDSGSYRFPQDVEKTGVAPSVRFGIGERTELALQYFYLKTKDVTDYGQPSLPPALTGTGRFEMPPVSPRHYYGYANHDFTNHETNIASARIEHKFSKAVSARNVLRWANYQRQVEATIATVRATDVNGVALTPATPLANVVVTRNHDGGRTRDNDDDVLINQTEVTWTPTFGGLRHTILGGLELGKERLNRWNYILDADPNTAGTQVPTSITPLLAPDPSTLLAYTKTPNTRARAEADTIAVYAQDQMDLTPTLKGLVGLRWEQYDATARTENAVTGAPATGPFSRKDDMVSGRLGLIFQPGDRQSYYVAFGNSYNPSGELGVYGGTGTALSATNDDVDPEENRTYEIGSQWDLAAGLQLRAAIFRGEKINARMADPAGSGLTVLEGKRRVDGIELQFAGTINPNWELYAAFAYQDGRIVRAPAATQGRKPLGVAEISGSLWTVYRLGGGFEVGGGPRYSSGVWLNDANTGKTPDYTVLDATAAYVQRNWEVRVNLYNLTDETYYVGGYQNNPNRVLPGTPRSGSVTVRYNF
jgi:catecholate siderophore receptor